MALFPQHRVFELGSVSQGKEIKGEESFFKKLKGAKVKKTSHGKGHRTKTDAKNIILSPADSIFAK